MKRVLSFVFALICAAAFAVLIFQLIMQTSYRLCPPNEAEIAEEPALMKYVEEKR